ncbi:MAG: hypothetical protein JXM79_25165 [Sedimentisphaerales bacterium]|nr:hypothetical protein [Sedimentisphaerales bacterium]
MPKVLRCCPFSNAGHRSSCVLRIAFLARRITHDAQYFIAGYGRPRGAVPTDYSNIPVKGMVRIAIVGIVKLRQ